MTDIRTAARAAASALAAATLAASALAAGPAALAATAHHVRAGAGAQSGTRHDTWPKFRHLGPGPVRWPAGVPRVPQPGAYSQLDGVSCASATSCWAVGTYASAGAVLNDMLHWNGRSWSRASVPSPGGTASGGYSELFSVRCRTAADCWAVGEYLLKTGADVDQAVHWNGRKWSVVPTPTPGGTLGQAVNELFDVVCTSSANCWAAGDYGSHATGSIVQLNQMLHWNGTRWSLVRTPSPGGEANGAISLLAGVRCPAADSCWAVGTYGTQFPGLIERNQAIRWNGRKWSVVAAPSPGGTSASGDYSELTGLACTSATSCWAAGVYSGSAPSRAALNEALHWNGTSWSQLTTPQPGGTGTGGSQVLYSITCTSRASCWAVGDYLSPVGLLNQAIHWNGTTWSLVPVPNPGDSNVLYAVRCVSAGSCWAVGGITPPATGSARNQALHWNGTKWSAT